jgi:potassium-transporting ATPase KdpC subunit
MMKELKDGLLFTLWTLVVFGLAHPLFVWGIGRVFFPREAEGSLIRRPDGTVVGSRLIGQAFEGDGYFHGRPSAVSYDAASTGATNYAFSNPAQASAVGKRVEEVAAREGVSPSRVPSDLVTASGSGVDPDLSPEAAAIQVARIARARHVRSERVREILDSHRSEPPYGLVGLFARPRLNVLELNLALDDVLESSSNGREWQR